MLALCRAHRLIYMSLWSGCVRAWLHGDIVFVICDVTADRTGQIYVGDAILEVSYEHVINAFLSLETYHVASHDHINIGLNKSYPKMELYFLSV